MEVELVPAQPKAAGRMFFVCPEVGDEETWSYVVEKTITVIGRATDSRKPDNDGFLGASRA
jgi:hypothetical protein